MGWPLALSAEPSFSLVSWGEKTIQRDLASPPAPVSYLPMHSARALNFLHLNSTQGVTRKHHHIIVPDASIHDHLSPCLDRRYIHISSLFCMLLSMAAAAWGFVYLPCDFVSYPFTRSLSLSSPPWLRTISSPPRLHLLHLHIWLSANGALSGNEQQSMYGQPVVMFLSDLQYMPVCSSLSSGCS